MDCHGVAPDRLALAFLTSPELENIFVKLNRSIGSDGLYGLVGRCPSATTATSPSTTLATWRRSSALALGISALLAVARGGRTAVADLGFGPLAGLARPRLLGGLLVGLALFIWLAVSIAATARSAASSVTAGSR